MTDGGRRAILAAALANMGIAVAKFVAFLVTGASSMLAESVHSVADTANQGLLILGGHRAARPPTDEHPFGFGRERYFWAFIVALVLFSMGAVFAVYEGVERLRHPAPIVDPAWAVGVLLASMGLEAFSLRTAMSAANEVRGGARWWDFIRRSKSPEIPVVLLEDVGALLGLLMALIAVTLSIVTGDARFDGFGSIAIGLLLGGIAWVMAVEMKSLLLGEAASEKRQAEIRDALEGHPEVVHVIHMRTEHLGPDELLVAAKLEFVRDRSVGELAALIDDVESRLRERVPIARVVYIEPDIRRGGSGG